MIQVRTVIMTVMTMRAIRVTVIDLLMVVLIERERESRAAMRRGSPRPPSWAEFVERLFALWMHGIVCVVFKDDSPKPPAWDLVLCVCVRWHGFIMFVAAGSADAGSRRCADAGGGRGLGLSCEGMPACRLKGSAPGPLGGVNHRFCVCLFVCGRGSFPVSLFLVVMLCFLFYVSLCVCVWWFGVFFRSWCC